VPDRRGQDHILVDPDVALALRAARDRQVMFAERTIFAPICVAKLIEL